MLMYADDTQLNISLKSIQKEETKICLEACLADLSKWFSENKLVCNPNKSNIVYFYSKYRDESSPFSISFGSSVLHPVDVALNLGVNLDKHLSMRSNISKICKTASLSLSRIGTLRKYLDINSIKKLVHAFISSKLDYCNAILIGLPGYQNWVLHWELGIGIGNWELGIGDWNWELGYQATRIQLLG